MSRRKVLMFLLSLFCIFLLIPLIVFEREVHSDDEIVTEKIDSNKEFVEVKKVSEDFIQNNFSYLYSSSDYGLISPDSKVFLKYLKYRNRYRETTLTESGETADKYSDIKNDYKYKDIKFIEKNFVKISVDVTTSFRYEQDKGISSLDLPYEVYLVKTGKDWKVWSAKCEDSISNPFDNKDKIDIISMCGMPSNVNKNSRNSIQSRSGLSDNAKISILDEMYDKEIKDFFDGINSDSDSKK